MPDLRRAEAQRDRPARDRNELIEDLISNGRLMMRKGETQAPLSIMTQAPPS